MIEALLAIFGAVAFGALSAAASAKRRVSECEDRIEIIGGIIARIHEGRARLEAEIESLRGEHKPETPSRN
jgi:hypothetical protein